MKGQEEEAEAGAVAAIGMATVLRSAVFGVWFWKSAKLPFSRRAARALALPAFVSAISTFWSGMNLPSPLFGVVKGGPCSKNRSGI
jgi:hypothetical protein